MNLLEIIGNYLIVTRNVGSGNEIIREFASKDSIYQHNETRAEITITGSRQSETITEDEITAGDWEDISGVLDLAGILDFLRANTGNFKTASGGNGALSVYKEFSLTDADIKSLSSGFELAPISGADKYYLVEFFTIEYTRGSIDFNNAAVDYIVLINNSANHRTLVDKEIFANAFGSVGDNSACAVNSIGAVATTPNIIYFSGGTTNQNLSLSTRNGADFTLGNGSAKVKIQYKLITI